MQKISIKNFGPIKETELSVNDCLIFIGPQASGKSTISKGIYFFKSLKDDLLKFITESVNNDIVSESELPTTAYKKKIRSKFVGFWGTTKHLNPFTIVFHYSDKKSIELSLRDGYVNANFSQEFHSELNEIFKQMSEYIKINNKSNDFSGRSYDPLAASEQRNFFKRIEFLTDSLFEDSHIPIYIPAGRSLLSILSEQLQKNLIGVISGRYSKESQDIDPYLLDLPLKAFIERISNLKQSYRSDLNDMINDKKKFTSEKIDFESVNKAKKIIEKVLRGRYLNDHLGERICLPDSQEYVKLSLASSGQQEAIWILLQIFAVILGDYKVFLVIEEPEAHLYPEAQKDIVALIGLLSNLNNNQILLTTHSPYILSSLNNLIYAHKIGQSVPQKVEQRIDRKIWISHSKVGAFFVDRGITQDIIDKELNLIKAETIDNASKIINDEFDFLFDLED
ncbi:MAG: AAA family ATPase [Desulfobacterales bacterium]